MRSWYHNLDYWTLILWLGLVIMGLLAIYSATQGEAHEFCGGSVRNNFFRQVTWLGISAIFIVILLLIPTRYYMDLALVGYFACIALLVCALLIGREVGGARSWVYIGPYGFQSSEIAKVGAIIAIARILSVRQQVRPMLTSMMAIGLLLLPAALIILQNDTGTALVFICLIPVVLFWAGTPLWFMALLVSPAIAGYLAIRNDLYLTILGSQIPIAAIIFTIMLGFAFHLWLDSTRLAALGGLINAGMVTVVFFAMEKVLLPHQVARINSFTNPEAPEFRSGVGFHLMQSKAAIGAGGWHGMGFMEGTQTQGAYIPEQSTDFIFSVIGEEFGFLGAILVLALFAMLLMRLVQLAANVNHPFGSMVAASTAGILLIQVGINIGMVLGLLPVIGIPLPLMSYGGSALLANTTLLAIVLNMHMRKKEFALYV